MILWRPKSLSCLSICKACLHISWNAARIFVKQYWCVLLQFVGTLQLWLEFDDSIWHFVFYVNFLCLNRYLFLEQKVLQKIKLRLMLGSLFLKHYSFRYNKWNSTNAPELLRYVYCTFSSLFTFSRRTRSTFQLKVVNCVLLCVNVYSTTATACQSNCS